jgi:hypothetical protein
MDLESEPAVQALIPLKTKSGVQSYTLTTQIINTVGQVHVQQTGAVVGICHFRIAAEAPMGFCVSYLSLFGRTVPEGTFQSMTFRSYY